MSSRPWEDRQAGLVSCEDCGRVFGVKPRQLRAINNGERTARCDYCIRGEVTAVTNTERQFWLAQFSMAEIRWMGECWFGVDGLQDESWRAGYVFEPITDIALLSLSASAEPEAA